MSIINNKTYSATDSEPVTNKKSNSEGQTVTVIKNADWVIAWDKEQQHHFYLNRADVAFKGDRLIHVGSDYSDYADTIIDGRNRMVMPGFVNIHSHLGSGNISKGIFDEVGAPALYGHALYSLSPLIRAETGDYPAAATSALCELMSSGVTTVVDIASAYPGWTELMGQSGMRVVMGAGFRQASWINVDDHRVDYRWDEQAGWKGLENAVSLAETAVSHPSGRLSAMIVPAQADTCTGELIEAAYLEAERLGLPFQIHTAQSMVEFYEILRRHGTSPIQWLDSLGVLSDRTIIGHGIYLDSHSWSPLRTNIDLPLIAEKGITVAHCPTVFGRTGMTMETVGRYIREGAHIGIGTDSFPYNMIEELRNAALYSRITAEDVFDVRTADLFHAATVGGARAVGREDIGRLCVGAKADLVVVDTSHPLMRPLHEPLRNLIYVAAERAVRDVYIDGLHVVKEGTVMTLDYEDAHSKEEQAQQRAITRIPAIDGKSRTIDEIAPLCLKVRDSV
jgi:cytosine/adenosine deaminase-related metal-dependent hydrolase